MVRNILNLAAGALFTLLMLEGACRFLPVMSGWENPPVTQDYPFVRYRPFGEFVYSQGWDLRQTTRGKFNSLGFSSPEPGPSTNVVIIGDSFVEASILKAEQRLAPLINAQHPGLHAVAMGRAGADLPDYMVTARWAAKRFKPAFVIFVISDGDLVNSLSPKRRGYWFEFVPGGGLGMRSEARFEFRNMLLNSRLASYVLYNLKFGPSMLVPTLRRRQAQARSATFDAVGVNRAAEAFLDAIAMIKRNGTTVVLVFDARREAIYAGRREVHTRDYGLLAGRAEDAGAMICDLSATFVARHASSGQRFDRGKGDGHWSAYGSSVVADAILEVIASSRATNTKSRQGI